MAVGARVLETATGRAGVVFRLLNRGGWAHVLWDNSSAPTAARLGGLQVTSEPTATTAAVARMPPRKSTETDMTTPRNGESFEKGQVVVDTKSGRRGVVQDSVPKMGWIKVQWDGVAVLSSARRTRLRLAGAEAPVAAATTSTQAVARSSSARMQAPSNNTDSIFVGRAVYDASGVKGKVLSMGGRGGWIQIVWDGAMNVTAARRSALHLSPPAKGALEPGNRVSVLSRDLEYKSGRALEVRKGKRMVLLDGETEPRAFLPQDLESEGADRPTVGSRVTVRDTSLAGKILSASKGPWRNVLLDDGRTKNFRTTDLVLADAPTTIRVGMRVRVKESAQLGTGVVVQVGSLGNIRVRLDTRLADGTEEVSVHRNRVRLLENEPPANDEPRPAALDVPEREAYDDDTIIEETQPKEDTLVAEEAPLVDQEEGAPALEPETTENIFDDDANDEAFEES